MTEVAWQDRAIEHSGSVARTLERSTKRARAIVDATRKKAVLAREDLTVEQLAKIAGVSLQTFYRYFPSKDELLLAVLEEEVRDGVEQMRALADSMDGPAARLRSIITAPLLVILVPDASQFVPRQHHRLADRFPAAVEQVVQPYIELLADELTAAVVAGVIDVDDIDGVARNIGLLVLTRYHHAALGMFTEDVEREAERLWTFCAAAVRLR